MLGPVAEISEIVAESSVFPSTGDCMGPCGGPLNSLLYKEGIYTPYIPLYIPLTYIILANLSVLYSLYNFPVLILLALSICILMGP